MSETEIESQAQQAEPIAAERGRYALWADEDGRLVAITRATELCERCHNCGCGTQHEPITLASITTLGKEIMKANGMSVKDAIKGAVRMMRRGD